MIVWSSHHESELPPEAGWLSAREAARAASMRYTKRHTEYLLARFAAKTALARRLELAPDPAVLARLEIRNAADGAPEAWLDGAPVPVALSLTDRAGWAVCALGPAGAAVGCDLELVEPRSPAFVRDYLTAPERALVEGARDARTHALLANLLWSAKESALKVLRTGLRRDTRSVEVALAAPGPAGWTDHEEWSPFAVHAVEGRRLDGWWRRYGDFVLTMAAASAMPPPTASHEPPPLASGVPSHDWLRSPLRF